MFPWDELLKESTPWAFAVACLWLYYDKDKRTESLIIQTNNLVNTTLNQLINAVNLCTRAIDGAVAKICELDDSNSQMLQTLTKIESRKE